MQMFHMETILGVPIYIANALIPILGNDSPNACAAFNGWDHKVFVNDKFLALPLFKKEPIIAHEIGHLVCQHLEKKMLTGNRQRELWQEFEADEYATRIVGVRRVYDMLLECRDDVMKYPRGRDRRTSLLDLTRRIDNIGGML